MNIISSAITCQNLRVHYIQSDLPVQTIPKGPSWCHVHQLIPTALFQNVSPFYSICLWCFDPLHTLVSLFPSLLCVCIQWPCLAWKSLPVSPLTQSYLVMEKRFLPKAVNSYNNSPIFFFFFLWGTKKWQIDIQRFDISPNTAWLFLGGLGQPSILSLKSFSEQIWLIQGLFDQNMSTCRHAFHVCILIALTIQSTHLHQRVLSVGIEPMTWRLLALCSTSWATEVLIWQSTLISARGPCGPPGYGPRRTAGEGLRLSYLSERLHFSA